LNRHYVTGVETRRVAGAGGRLRRIAALHVVEVERRGVLEDAERVREILVSHRVPPADQSGEVRIACGVVVNCLGAWSPIFSAKVGVADVTEPVRRQICLVDVHASDLAPGVDLGSLGMIVDASDSHPEGSYVLAGYSIPDEGSGFDFDYDGDAFFETHIYAARPPGAVSSAAARARWSGLYEVTPDRRELPVPFPALRTSRRTPSRACVMQSYAVGSAMAERIDTGAWGDRSSAAGPHAVRAPGALGDRGAAI
jgi:hypothetical protein